MDGLGTRRLWRSALAVIIGVPAMALALGAASPDGVAQAAPRAIDIPTSGPLGPVTVFGDSVLLGSALYGPTLPDRLAEQGWGPIRFRAGEGYNTRTTGSFGAGTWFRQWRSEGWDAPQTAILIMARPTFSKVLYTQQLGRGLRNHPGKEALYVIDVVDNYGARMKPFSLHALFKIPNYQPFDNLIDPDKNKREEEIIVLDGLYEGERRGEPGDIFSFEEMYGAYLNEEQLVRELFVSTGTVRQWLRQGKIRSDVRYPFGRQQLHFFDPDRLTQLTEDLHAYYHKLEITLEKEDYSFLLPDSYAHEEGDAEQPLFCDVPPEEDKFTRVLPYYPLSIAAGDFMDSVVPDAPETWFVVEGLTGRRTLAPSMFVAQVQGKSMEPLIPDGAYCLFTFEVGGSRNGRIILAQQADISDQDTGASYTVKSYQSSKKMDPDSGWQHESITLKAVNPAYDDIIILPEESEDFRVVAFFMEVLEAEA